MTLKLLFTVLLAAQGIVVPADNGTVSGVLKTPDGTPAAGVRVAAMLRPQSPEDAAGAASLVSIAETDAAGRFRLENIPPGRYYITAGRVDLPTFFPGTTDMSKSTALLVTAGVVISGIDFTMAGASDLFVTINWAIPARVVMEGGEPIPVFADGNFPALRMTRVSDGAWSEMRMNASSISPRDSPGSEYRVTIENVPPGYAVKSMTFGATDLTIDTLRVSMTNFAVPTNAYLTNGTVAPVLLLGTTAVGTFTAISRTVTSSPGISVTLAMKPPTPAQSGVHVAGQVRAGALREIYISGNPGILYSDGTFEFRGVSPGRHIVAAIDSLGPPLAAYIVVGNQNMDGIQLVETPLLPLNAGSPTAPLPAGNLAPGSSVRLATLRGQVKSEATQQPVNSGAITVFGASNSRMTYPISDGRFEIPQLLPGAYSIEISIFDHFTLSRSIDMSNEDATLDLGLRRAY